MTDSFSDSGSFSGGDSYRDTGPRRWRRCAEDRMLGGVAGGTAEYLDIDPTLVRVALVVLALLGGLAVPLYAAAWLLVPAEDAATSIAEDLFAGAGGGRPMPWQGGR